jgi:hypothetical protein
MAGPMDVGCISKMNLEAQGGFGMCSNLSLFVVLYGESPWKDLGRGVEGPVS